MRSFNYQKDHNIITTTIKGYVLELHKELLLLSEYENNIEYKKALETIKNFKEKYSDLNLISDTILEDLISPYSIEYFYEHNHYPSDASKLGLEFDRDLQEIIELEEKLKTIAISSWKNKLTTYESIVNGENFMVVGHGTSNFSGINEFEGDNKNNPHRNQYISCSLFSHNELNVFFKQKIVYLVDVNEANYIAASYMDAATVMTSYPSFNVLKEVIVDGLVNYIDVGLNYNSKGSVTTILTPELLEKLSIKREIQENGEMYKYDKSTTNEIVLDRNTTLTKGILLISNGCDLLLDEYMFLKRQGLNFKCINKGIYREKQGLSIYTPEERTNFIIKMHSLEQRINNGFIPLEMLQSYYEEVIIPMNYSDLVMEEINSIFSKYIDIDQPKL